MNLFMYGMMAKLACKGTWDLHVRYLPLARLCNARFTLPIPLQPDHSLTVADRFCEAIVRGSGESPEKFHVGIFPLQSQLSRSGREQIGREKSAQNRQCEPGIRRWICASVLATSQMHFLPVRIYTSIHTYSAQQNA